jgi:GTPase SAR1 family protein
MGFTTIQLCLCGDADVGKTCLAMSYMDNQFPSNPPQVLDPREEAGTLFNTHVNSPSVVRNGSIQRQVH